MLNNIRLCGLLVGLLFILQSCHDPSSDEFGVEDFNELSSILNKNILSIQEIVSRQVNDERLFAVNSSVSDETLLYFQDEESPISLYHISENIPVNYPCISILPEGDDYYWAISKHFIQTGGNNKIRVTDRLHTPTLHFVDGHWVCNVGSTEFIIDDVALSKGYTFVSQANNDFSLVHFTSGYQLSIPMVGIQIPHALNKAFYKDIFLDAGIGLTSRKFLYAAQKLDMSLEGISFSRWNASKKEESLQNEILGGNEEDTNGRLLYPDGQPRYKLLFVNGGKSTTHASSVNELSRNNCRLFVSNGGSYVGTCAGAFFASKGYDQNEDVPSYLSIWPSVMIHTGISDGQTGMFIEDNSPLLKYYNYGGDHYISNVRHNGGGYPRDLPEGTEILARYDYPSLNKVHMQPCVWSYKAADNLSGRVVLEGSHPEEAPDGERRDLTAAMIQYAIDGQGDAQIKGILQNGKERVMDKKTEDKNPLFARIGDMQCHHFIVYIPADAHDITIDLKSDVDCDMALMANRGTFAFPDIAEYKTTDGGGNQRLTFQTLEEGAWYISVQCLTTVDVTETEFGQDYFGRTDVLNGISYKLYVKWD
ncbi:MAG: hypothetical protein IJJ98_08165 [Prevotella sp.]|nr:hypothetical protein [Prevotella sp.]